MWFISIHSFTVLGCFSVGTYRKSNSFTSTESFASRGTFLTTTQCSSSNLAQQQQHQRWRLKRFTEKSNVWISLKTFFPHHRIAVVLILGGVVFDVRKLRLFIVSRGNGNPTSNQPTKHGVGMNLNRVENVRKVEPFPCLYCRRLDGELVAVIHLQIWSGFL